MPLEMFAAQADLVTHDFIAELENIQPAGAGSGWKTAGLGPVALDDRQTAVRHFRMRRCGFSTRGP
jgi:hypothetical protein